MPKTRFIVFTINNWTGDDERSLEALGPTVPYLVYGYETGEAGTHHLQGYVIFSKPLSIEEARICLGGRAHVEFKRGTHEQAATYCKKDGLFKEYGEVPRSVGVKGQFEAFIEWFMSYYQDNERAPTEKEVAKAYPTLFVRYGRKLQELIKYHLPPPTLEKSKDLRPWQKKLEDILKETPKEDRSILFFVDAQGGKGKTWFQRYMLTNYPEEVQVLSCGKRDDVAHAIDVDKRIFLFNIPRKSMEYFNYNIIEQLKDRMVFSPKYDSQTKILNNNPHVVVFSNEYPKMDDMTADRYVIIEDFDEFVESETL